jgi:hypothetical protein
VSDQESLPVVVDEGVGDCDVVGGVGELCFLLLAICLCQICGREGKGVDVHQSDRRSSPCRGHGQRRRRSGRSRRCWSTLIPLLVWGS